MLQEGLPLLKSQMNKLTLLVSFSILLVACQTKKNSILPIFGERETDEKGDTIYQQIPEFSFVNQFGDSITQKKFDSKIYIADFFFTTCPGICPVMTKQLKRVQSAFEQDEEKILILSHTVDPETDSIPRLLEYGKEQGANFNTWDFVTGSKKKLYKMAEKYLVVANEDPNTEIHFVHSDKLVLIDKQKRIRGMYSGIDSLEVNKLIQDIKTLKQEPWK